MHSPFEIHHGLPSSTQEQAAALYWQAFGEKLGKLLGPRQNALQFFADTLHPPSCICALAPDGQMLGVAAVQLDGAGFTKAGFGKLWKHYGISSLWRLVPLAMLERSCPPDTLQMDGICVSDQARGMGIGTALLNAVFETARTKGFGKVTLDVIDTNPRAQSLYERRGFVAVSKEPTSILRPLLGFEYATKMVRDIQDS